ncbi:gamma-glutamyltransferase [Pseudomonas putida]|uniref:gamma-glutamyltransferase n=1 Tax=Pseudomonas putida TaxID=303 RepID=UPI000771728A|nr:gamma-glutamyltransferase [Pseudomonas putida]KWW11839.1 gamma-glutamyltransferase [Pseudomonas putida]MCE0877995.1 gamma-glutamyltransferase [Pseudomonas putida]MCE0961052.1 gamma-glutamyltransferase [Pseudomonas putida]MCE0970626.1 gamma-glutamyltransferase [Pseudomonas putida]MDD2117938.1 gamma-glutamyltransferase [Pseudomonas putida]
MKFSSPLMSALCLAIASGWACAEQVLPAPPELASGYRTGLQPVHASRHMAAAANPLATEAGRAMLRAGGSAIDAAIAMQMVLTLVEPQSSGIGGGAFILYWDGTRVQAFDGREAAPSQVTEKLFLQADGSPMPFRSAQIGGRSVGVPGVLRALKLAHEQHGKLPWQQLFAPAIALARNGFAVSERLHTLVAGDPYIARSPAMARYFLDKNGKPLAVGTTLRNPELAQTFEQIAAHGPQAFYTGEIARAIVAKVRSHANAGYLSLQDLEQYSAKERDPVCGPYKAWRICGMPPPSSGGVTVLQTLGMLEAVQRATPERDLADLRPLTNTSPSGLEASPLAVHLIAEAERLAYADRAQYLADSDYVPVPVKALTDPTYLASRAAQIGEHSMKRARPGQPQGADLALAPDRSPLRISTSHLSAVDDSGQALAMTTSVEAAFGSHLMVKGFLLNNHLTDFSFIPREHGKPVANRVQPGKRPLSAMAPTLVFSRASGELVASLGSPGGSQIIGYVNKALIGLLDWQLDPQQAAGLPNFGSRNAGTEVEAGLASQSLIRQLAAWGHEVTPMTMTSGMQIIQRSGDGWSGGADPRREGVALGD